MIELLLASGGSNRLIPFNLFKLILTLKTNLLQQVIMTTLEQNSLWQFQILSSNTFHMNEMTFRANWHLLQSGVKLNRRNEKKKKVWGEGQVEAWGKDVRKTTRGQGYRGKRENRGWDRHQIVILKLLLC